MAAFEVLSLDPAVPQIRAPGASDTYTFPRAVELPLGTANGVLYLNGSKVVSSGSALTWDGTRFTVGTKASLLADSPFVTGANLSSGSGNLAIGGETGSAFIGFFANNLEQARLNLTGLGIGTNNPLSKLHVVGASVSGAAAPAAVDYANLDVANGGFLNFRNSSGGVGLAGLLFSNNVRNIGNIAYDFSLNAIQFRTNGGDRMLLDSSGNLGLGVTPSPWFANRTAIEIGDSVGAIVQKFGHMQVGTSYYANPSTGADTYSVSGTPATKYAQENGVHAWHTAPSGTAGNAISFTQAMTLDSGGRLLVGYTSNSDSAAGGGQFAGPLVVGGALTANQTDRVVLQYGGGGQGTLRAFGNSPGSGFLTFWTGGGGGGGDTERMRLDANGNVIVNTAAIATNATNGFLYVPTCAGTPTGTPTTYTGRSPIVVDTTNNKLYFYSGGQWRDAGP